MFVTTSSYLKTARFTSSPGTPREQLGLGTQLYLRRGFVANKSLKSTGRIPVTPDLWPGPDTPAHQQQNSVLGAPTHSGGSSSWKWLTAEGGLRIWDTDVV